MCDIETQSETLPSTTTPEDLCYDSERKPLNTDLNLILVKNVIQTEENGSLDSPVKLIMKMKARRQARQTTWIVTILAFGNFCVAAGVSIQGPFFPKEAGIDSQVVSKFIGGFTTGKG